MAMAYQLVSCDSDTGRLRRATPSEVEAHRDSTDFTPADHPSYSCYVIWAADDITGGEINYYHDFGHWPRRKMAPDGRRYWYGWGVPHYLP